MRVATDVGGQACRDKSEMGAVRRLHGFGICFTSWGSSGCRRGVGATVGRLAPSRLDILAGARFVLQRDGGAARERAGGRAG